MLVTELPVTNLNAFSVMTFVLIVFKQRISYLLTPPHTHISLVDRGELFNGHHQKCCEDLY